MRTNVATTHRPEEVGSDEDDHDMLTFYFRTDAPMGLTLRDDAKARALAGKENGGLWDGAVSVMRLERSPGGGRGEAEKLGVRTGDVLAAVNGTDVRHVAFGEVCREIRDAELPKALTMFRPVA